MERAEFIVSLFDSLTHKIAFAIRQSADLGTSDSVLSTSSHHSSSQSSATLHLSRSFSLDMKCEESRVEYPYWCHEFFVRSSKWLALGDSLAAQLISIYYRIMPCVRVYCLALNQFGVKLSQCLEFYTSLLHKHADVEYVQLFLLDLSIYFEQLHCVSQTCGYLVAKGAFFFDKTTGALLLGSSWAQGCMSFLLTLDGVQREKLTDHPAAIFMLFQHLFAGDSSDVCATLAYECLYRLPISTFQVLFRIPFSIMAKNPFL